MRTVIEKESVVVLVYITIFHYYTIFLSNNNKQKM